MDLITLQSSSNYPKRYQQRQQLIGYVNTTDGSFLNENSRKITDHRRMRTVDNPAKNADKDEKENIIYMYIAIILLTILTILSIYILIKIIQKIKSKKLPNYENSHGIGESRNKNQPVLKSILKNTNENNNECTIVNARCQRQCQIEIINDAFRNGTLPDRSQDDIEWLHGRLFEGGVEREGDPPPYCGEKKEIKI